MNSCSKVGDLNFFGVRNPPKQKTLRKHWPFMFSLSKGGDSIPLLHDLLVMWHCLDKSSLDFSLIDTVVLQKAGHGLLSSFQTLPNLLVPLIPEKWGSQIFLAHWNKMQITFWIWIITCLYLFHAMEIQACSLPGVPEADRRCFSLPIREH